MAQFVNKLRDCVRTVNLTMLLVLNLFFIVTLNLTVATVLVVLEADHGFFIQDGSVSIGIPDEGFSHAAPLALTLSDASGNVSDVAWQVDGKAVGANPKLPAGEHALTAVVTDAGDNSARYIVKYITVK